LLPLPKTEQKIDVILGIDAGYTSPTVVLPFFLYEHKWNLRCRIMLKEKMIPDDQAELIDYIADFYNAGIISLDTTSSEGRAPATSLTNPKNKKYINKNYAERVVMASFQTKMIMGYTADGTEISDNVKNGTTTILRQMFAREEFLLYNDEDLLEEFNREVKKKTKETISISTPQDVHIPDAFRCFAFGYFAKYGGVEKPSKKVNYELQYPVYKNILQLFGRR